MIIAGLPRVSCLATVMRGLDPRIHDELPFEKSYAKISRFETHHGLPGRARQ
jgi:hypothetical protein